ncbi:hypothetical protein N5I08_05405 [Acinetobacter johnsonii]|uniref:hypothetical protein n=1 Tax=Acinetobacter johnsonii TaxID=40214 RepID=UPI002448A8BC|nr:hypothetical protein [Acinetobacter johnsonii]MDH1518461.1 hypothetical protein [Acinetobacter johnsonii]
MEELIKNLDATNIAALIGAVGAVGAGLIALIGVIATMFFTRKHRLGIEVKSKHRQDWINSLRADIALICSKANFITYDMRSILEIEHKQNPENKRTFSEYIILNSEIESASLRVDLFLNPNEEKHQKLNTYINTLKESLKTLINENLKPDSLMNRDTVKTTRDTIDKTIKSIVSTSQEIFKEEWTRIKEGK